MIFHGDGTKPIYIQIAEWLENELLSEKMKPDEKIYSQYQLAEMFTINPATAAKGLNMLADEGIVYKKRGLGMFVSSEANSIILNKRKTKILTKMISDLVEEAKRLEVSEMELIKMIKTANSEGDE